MTIPLASYTPMAQASPYTDPLVIGVTVVALVAFVLAALITYRIVNDWSLTAFVAALVLALGAGAFFLTSESVQHDNPVYQSEADKIVHNVKEKYDVATVSLSVPNTRSGFIKDGKTGNYLSTVWINRSQEGKVSSEVYNLVVDANTGEPMLSKMENAASQTDPSSFERK